MNKILQIVIIFLVVVSFWQYYEKNSCLNERITLLYNLEVCKFEKEDNSRVRTAIEQIKAIDDNITDEEWL